MITDFGKFCKRFFQLAYHGSPFKFDRFDFTHFKNDNCLNLKLALS